MEGPAGLPVRCLRRFVDRTEYLVDMAALVGYCLWAAVMDLVDEARVALETRKDRKARREQAALEDPSGFSSKES